MKGMASAVEDFVAPAPGRYESEIINAEPEISKKSGCTMIKLTIEVKSPEDYAGAQAFDYLITDGSAKGGGMGKKKLRGLGINVDASDDEIPDIAICDHLRNKRLWVQFGNEQMMGKDAKGDYTIPKFRADPKTGLQVPVMKLTVEEYFLHNVGGAGQATGLVQAQLPLQGQIAPQQLQGQALPQGFVPVQGGFAPNPGFNPNQPVYGQQPPLQPQYAAAPGAVGLQTQQPLNQQLPLQQPQGLQGFAQAPQAVTQAAIPQGQVLQAPAGFQQGQAPNGQAQTASPPWVAAQALAQGQAQAEGGEAGGKRGRKTK